MLAFTATPGLTAQSLQEPIDFFHLFTEEVKNNVFIETCKYADQKTQQNAEYLQNHKEARGNQWLKKPMKIEELNPLVAILLTMGIVGYPKVR